MENEKLNCVIHCALAQKIVARSSYARNVLRGRQNWSGSDLQGRAKKFGNTYRILRNKAAIALRAAGGVIVQVEHGRLESAVYVGPDDYGNAIYITREGMYSPRKTNSMRLCKVEAAQ